MPQWLQDILTTFAAPVGTFVVTAVVNFFKKTVAPLAPDWIIPMIVVPLLSAIAASLVHVTGAPWLVLWLASNAAAWIHQVIDNLGKPSGS